MVESGQTVYPWTLQDTQYHWKPCMLMTSHCSTVFHWWCCMLWIMSCSKPSPYTFFFPSFWYRLILISAVQRMLFQKWSVFFRCFLVESNLALFAPCGEPSVFALVKSSLDCRLWQRHIYLLESVLHLAECCERVFLYHREDPPIIQHCCPPWPYRPLICCWAHQCVLFFSECTKLLIWPLLMLLQFFWFWCISFVFEA